MKTKKILIAFRQNKKNGSKIEDVFTPESIANNIPNRWEFCSKLNIPQNYKDNYTMAYNTKETEYFN